MEGVAAGAQIGARQSAEGQLCAVRAAANGVGDGGAACALDGLPGVGQYLGVLLDDLRHVAVLILYRQRGCPCAVFGVDGRFDVRHALLALDKTVGVVVADDIVQRGGGYCALYLQQVVKALAALRVARRLALRQHTVDLCRHQRGVDHGVLALSRMDGHTADLPFGPGGMKGLILDLVGCRAVHGVGQLRAEAIQVQQGRAVADLLVRREADADRAVGCVSGKNPLAHGHDLRNARLVVRTQHRCAVGGDQGLALQGGQMGEALRRELQAAASQGDAAAVIAFDDLGLGRAVTGVRAGVQMGDKSHAAAGLIPGGGGDLAVDIGVLVYVDVRHAQFAELLRQLVRQHDLPRRGRRYLGCLIAACVDGRVPQQPFISSCHGVCPPCLILI